MAERDVQARVLLEFGALPFLTFWRQAVGGAKYVELGTDARGNVKPIQRFVKYGLPGSADVSGILACGKRIELETKSADGTQSPEQKSFERMIKAHNGIYAVVRSNADVQSVLDSHLERCTLCENKRQGKACFHSV